MQEQSKAVEPHLCDLSRPATDTLNSMLAFVDMLEEIHLAQSPMSESQLSMPEWALLGLFL